MGRLPSSIHHRLSVLSNLTVEAVGTDGGRVPRQKLGQRSQGQFGLRTFLPTLRGESTPCITVSDGMRGESSFHKSSPICKYIYLDPSTGTCLPCLIPTIVCRPRVTILDCLLGGPKCDSIWRGPPQTKGFGGT